MTLTQVSTWFANARRRLKKENKMTWEPRNRVDDEDNNNEDAEPRKGDDPAKEVAKETPSHDSKDSGTGSSEDSDVRGRSRIDVVQRGVDGGRDSASECGASSGSDIRHDEVSSGPESPECMYDKCESYKVSATSPPSTASIITDSPSGPPASTSTSGIVKPRIWSLADMASKGSDVHSSGLTSAFYSTASLSGGSGGGKIIPPLTARSVHGPSPYARPPDFYRGPYGAAALGSEALLGSYSRTFALNGVASMTTSSGLTPLSTVLPKAGSATAFPINGGLGLSQLSSAASGSSIEQQLQTVGLHTAVRVPPTVTSTDTRPAKP